MAPTPDSDAPSPCSIARALDVIGDAWSILVLRDAFRGIRRFDEIQRDLAIAKPVLADRLKRLVDAGVLEKRQYCEHPPRFEYRLTQMGRDLSPALVSLMRWGDTYLSGSDGAPVVLVHDACGNELDLTYVCWQCDQTFTPTEIASRPGPGSHRAVSPIPHPPAIHRSAKPTTHRSAKPTTHRSAKPTTHPGGSRVRTRRSVG